ncbi:hypothetical protein GOP47_0024743 [Adiantum capillus-veneris]|uniref:Kinesin-like protein n=1 Tax=Adiantum capillus-veneris TaxID=13818 RepID=A0A9D4Z2X8_ADICA|nr:hypothetical protein GOP47_0024743 [Adiantum capillus-veneris]
MHQSSPLQNAKRRAGRVEDDGISSWMKGDTGCGSRLRSMSKLALSCPRPAPNPPDYGDTGCIGGHTELNMRKRPPRDDLETVMEEGEPGSYTRGGRIMVYVRMRPLSKSEKDAGARSCVRVVNKQDVYLAEFASETDYLRLKRLKGRHFVFDAAFPDATGQQEVYNTSTADLVEGVLQGRNGSVFCYGATGAGKTHTMLGSTHNPGVMVLAFKDLFAKLRQHSREGDYVVRLSYLEVYNESVRDLLSPGRPLILREDSKQGTVAAGLTHYQAYSADEVMALLHQGNQNRTTEPTRVNETSSRSHAILQVAVEYKVHHESHYVCRTGKLSLIDLAGSERALATDQRTIRSLEGANINRSLLALSSCINALVEGKRHIPFRNSKLTQLLKDSLGGACQTSMIANISPSNLSFGETQNTLHWADRAKQIRTKACEANEEVQVPESESEQAKLLLEVQKENQQLRMQLARLQQKLLSVESSAIMVARHSPAPAATMPTPIFRTPVSESKATRHDECRAVEEVLRKKVTVLEKEKESACREMEGREAKLAAFISSLQRDHSVQLRHKDDFIRTLCSLKQKMEAAEEERVENVVPPSAALSRTRSLAEHLDASRSNRRASVAGAPRRMTMGGAAVPISTNLGKGSVHQAGMKRPAVPSTPTSTVKTRRSKLQETEENQVPAMPQSQRLQQQSTRRLSKIPVPPAHLPVQLPKTPTTSKGAMKKRTFWDITNANSPSAPVGRCTRSNTAATPSMLLQPGFLGGGRRCLLQ